jgi:formylglycine-generating enzyme required for sulfatase activity
MVGSCFGSHQHTRYDPSPKAPYCDGAASGFSFDRGARVNDDVSALHKERGPVMATRQAWAGLAAVLAAAMILWGAGCSSKPPKELTLDLGGGATMRMVLVPAGKFLMGGILFKPVGNTIITGYNGQHEVTISKPFFMGVTEVTQAQYEAVMGSNPSLNKGPTNPVDTVSWDDATEFCEKLSVKTHQAIRLPTEAEWEYACRAGSTTEFSFGDAEADLGDYAWYSANSGSKTHPVGQKKPNAWGLYDMHGNVWEWCADWFPIPYPKGAVTDPQGDGAGLMYNFRGGAWDSDPGFCRSASRSGTDRNYRSYNLGFRVAASVTAP